jgi:hypothetical protein
MKQSVTSLACSLETKNHTNMQSEVNLEKGNVLFICVALTLSSDVTVYASSESSA